MITEEDFLRTMIETVKYDGYNNKDELLGILRNAVLTYNKTTTFTKKSWQSQEYIDLRVPIPMMQAARGLQSPLEYLARQVYIETPEYGFAGLSIKPKPINYEFEELIDHNVVFNEIKDTIIQGIRDAKYTIWVAVAWFTDEDIHKELLIKKRLGVNVRIITSDEPSNSKIMDKLESSFDVKKISKSGWSGSNRLHDKFCIIDLEYVMHGSYNWSKNAINNDETLATALDRDFVKKFADEFLLLYTK